jgi:hypothetical protein
VDGAIGLIVAADVYPLDRDRAADRVLPDRRRDRAASDADRADLADIDGLDVHFLL